MALMQEIAFRSFEEAQVSVRNKDWPAMEP